MICQRSILSKPEPCEEEPPRQRHLATVEVDTDAETIRLLDPIGHILYEATWELWGTQLLVQTV